VLRNHALFHAAGNIWLLVANKQVRSFLMSQTLSSVSLMGIGVSGSCLKEFM